MKNRYTKQITAMGLFAVALWTAACGGGTNTPSASTDKGPIQIWTMEDSTAFSGLMQNFTTQTGIPVQVEAVPWGNVNDNLTTAVPSGNGPDLMQIGLSFLPSSHSARDLLDLSPYGKDHARLQS